MATKLVLEFPLWNERPGAWQQTLQLGSFHDRLITASPRRIKLAVAYEPTRKQMGLRSFPLLLFGRFRFPYGVIEEIAQILGAVSRDAGVLPLLQPIALSSVSSLSDSSRLGARIMNTGVQVFPARHIRADGRKLP